ncbi:MAG: alpha/beta hydrolase [Flavobacteriaceae bacterium]|nr:alpha/beta hydrolase [Flavobacteriaceae bacterium]
MLKTNLFSFLFVLNLLLISCESSSKNYETVVKDESFRKDVLKSNPGDYVKLTNGYTYFEDVNINSQIGNVVLVHGFSVPSYIMRTTFNSIKERGYRVIMMDLYGRGFSDNPNLPQTDKLRATQVIELMKSRGVKSASLVGLSNGGRIISKIADLEPELVNNLFYIASSGFYEYEEIDDKNVYQKEIDDMILKYPEMAEGQVNDFFEGDKYPNWITQYEELQTHEGFARALISTTKNLVTLDDVHSKINSLDIPVYTFWGEFDNVVVYDKFKDRINKLLPTRKEFFISNSGHLPHMENQDEFEKIFFKYLTN